MRIDPKGHIAGFPALMVRDFLRRYFVSNFSLISVENFTKTSIYESRPFISALEAEGLVNRVEDSEGEYWECSNEGRRLAMATAAAPIRRATAERLVREVLDRARTVNSDSGYLFCVNRVAVFGSYLTGAVRLSDVDLAIELICRVSDPEEYRRLKDARIDLARKRGWRSRNLVDLVAYPKQEVLDFLKGRSRAISLHAYGELVELGIRYQTIYSARSEI